MPTAVAPVSQLRGRQMRALAAKTWWRVTIVVVPIAVGTLAAVVFSDLNSAAVFLAAALLTALAALVGTYLLADSRARAAFLEAWARSRGWTAGTGPWLDEATPLLRDGDRRESGNYLHGPLAGGGEAALCHYTYEVRHESSSSNGTTTSWESHEFTVVETEVAAPDIPTLSLHPRSFGDNRMFDGIDSALTADRVVQLESSELQHEYKLEVADSASDLAVRQLFEPAFIVWCLDQAADGMLVEIENGLLVVAIPDHSFDAAELDDLVDKTATVAARLAEAHAATATAT
jgi:hypothetical protein